MKRTAKSSKKGLTLVELIVVIVIMAIILVAVIGVLGYKLIQASEMMDYMGFFSMNLFG